MATGYENVISMASKNVAQDRLIANVERITTVSSIVSASYDEFTRNQADGRRQMTEDTM